jgi:hypothetical protein
MRDRGAHRDRERQDQRDRRAVACNARDAHRGERRHEREPQPAVREGVAAGTEEEGEPRAGDREQIDVLALALHEPDDREQREREVAHDVDGVREPEL